MNGGDSPIMLVYPPVELSDESVHAISDFLYEFCRSFDHLYAEQLSRPRYTREDRISLFPCEVEDDEEEPF